MNPIRPKCVDTPNRSFDIVACLSTEFCIGRVAYALMIRLLPLLELSQRVGFIGLLCFAFATAIPNSHRDDESEKREHNNRNVFSSRKLAGWAHERFTL